ncbi:transcription antitermination factor NusB [Capnocytophaga canimorsus]|uniref:Transcription antitermination factor NusB n=1 Tax=Capnocytophaga canimorsus TaxID=28188 RepID=A0A0B7I4N0_9FLAO|nr:transcription antitermination factor NusB [Capnocytophaga canimorsus]ATA76115.1 transcription antitermination factor NusB [Capnocytophaga canimorsus]ATA92867.1 transcription antitermination factor NusB [Capnocytophaga canimorsus]PJI80311.1 NusB antitermination factor [Capnocytophaga canimorsus]CEN45704.1 N utilization substance protein B-like protein [Capnocytophaga canimorsus]STA71218.1 N utilization substance protein B homolog [Capnocytophaga canimorsus]
MLTRRHIRVKVMQGIYALKQSQSQNLDKELKFLQQSIGEMNHLYLLLLSLLKELHQMAENHIEIGQKKYLATVKDKNPNRKFIQNQILLQIVNNQLLEEAIVAAKMNRWDLDEEYVKIIYKKITESDLYRNYMSEKQNSFESDRDFVVQLFKKVIATDEKLYEYIEDFNLTWTDDLPIVNTYIVKLLNKVETDTPEKYFVPKLFKDDEDKAFANELLKKTALNDESLQEKINDKTPNWDKERIASIDNIILKMAICEFLKFPSIPVKVTLNEYLEVAKEYSTEKSSIFINGILDSLAKELSESGELKKTGRGLL